MRQTDAEGRPASPPLPHRPSGLRRLTPPMLPSTRAAEAFTGGDITPGHVLAAFKAAAPHLGYSARVVQTIDWLFRFTQAQDWQPGSRPIVWPSAALQADELGITQTQAKRINRHLAELGLLVMRDSPNGKRYGKRDQDGRIIEAYGFDLSPLAMRQDEFREVAAAGRDERDAVARLRRRASIARASLRQTWETYAEQEIAAPADLKAAGEAASQALRGLDSSDRLLPAVAALEKAAANARGALEAALATRANVEKPAVADVGTCPKGHANVPHIRATTQLPNLYQDTDSFGKCSAQPETARATPRPQSGPQRPTSGAATTMITPSVIAAIAPDLRAYLPKPSSPTWPEIVDAADWLRQHLGVSKALWGEACITMGRERAAVALAIVSAKPAGHFRGSPGGYFHGMVTKARVGELHLDRTLAALRQHAGFAPHHRASHMQ